MAACCLPERICRTPGSGRWAERLTGYWLDFARTGDPNDDSRLRWPQFREEDDRWLVFGIEDDVRRGVARARLDFIGARYLQRIQVAAAAVNLP